MEKMTRTAPHETARYWTPDQVAECLDGISLPLSSRLWTLMALGEAHPLGGDGSEGTIEWPELPEVDHSVVALWSELTEAERHEINAALNARGLNHA